MGGRIIDLSERSRRSGKAEHAPGTEPKSNSTARLQRSAPALIHEWDADIVAMCRIERGVVPPTANVRWTVDIDPLRRSYSVAVYREGWQHNLILQSAYRPDETPEQAIRREAILWFINQMLSASYGVPA